jgi:hypothetical protein
MRGIMCEKCEHYKKLALVNLESLKKQVEADKEFKKELEKVCDAIVKAPVEKPVMYFEFPDHVLNYRELMDWYDCVENYYHIAKRYEAQERGTCCSVDRAYSGYLRPECVKLLEHFKKHKEEL